MSDKQGHSGQAEWGSRFGYLMVAAGASIGLGNIWKFPYLAYRGGGGIFLVVYIIVILLLRICAPAARNTSHLHDRTDRVEEERGSERGIKMLLKKMAGEQFVTDLPMPKFDRVEPAAPITDMKHAKLAVVTSGGIVPQGNPDHIESSNATKFGKYSIEGMQRMDKKDFMTVHGGYDRQFVLEDPNLVVPLDVLRELQAEGEFGELEETFYATTGTGTSTGSAAKFGDAIGSILVEHNVDGVILVST